MTLGSRAGEQLARLCRCLARGTDGWAGWFGGLRLPEGPCLPACPVWSLQKSGSEVPIELQAFDFHGCWATPAQPGRRGGLGRAGLGWERASAIWPGVLVLEPSPVSQNSHGNEAGRLALGPRAPQPKMLRGDPAAPGPFTRQSQHAFNGPPATCWVFPPWGRMERKRVLGSLPFLGTPWARLSFLSAPRLPCPSASGQPRSRPAVSPRVSGASGVRNGCRSLRGRGGETRCTCSFPL